MKLGIDIGRVLITPEGRGTSGDTSFIGGSIQDALDTPPYDGMFDVVPALVELFHGDVWLVSKCGPRVQEKSRLWLQHHRFFERTGMASANLRFCLERPQKAGICSKLGITHFIDDRADVLKCMNGVVAHRYLFGPQKTDQTPHGMVAVPAWDTALPLIEATLMQTS